MEYLLFPLVGAVIGALTNHLAIKMLFRPYRPVVVAGVRLPLTPGVIPRERHTIARNIAETFETQLFSGEEIHRVLTGERTHAVVEQKVDELLAGLGPFASMAQGMKPQVVAKVLAAVEEMADEAIRSGGELDIGQRIEQKIDAMELARLEALVLGFSDRHFRHITWFGGLLGALIGLAQAGLSQLLG